MLQMVERLGSIAAHLPEVKRLLRLELRGGRAQDVVSALKW